MGAWEDDAGMAGDELATLVDMGYLCDADVLAYFAGDRDAQAKVERVLDETAGVYGHESQDAYDEGLR